MKNIYLIRHGQPNFPEGKGMCIGTTDLPLSGTGFQQAEKAAKSLPPVAAVFSSPLTRAVQTAQAIGQPVTIVEDLREMHAGEWDGLTFEEIRQRYPDLYAARGIDSTLPLPGGEDHDAALARFSAAMEQIAPTAPGDFAVVAHGGVIAQFLQQVTGTWYKPDYAEVVPLVWDGVRFTPPVKKRLFLTGPIGCGKSTAIQWALEGQMAQCGGFLTRRYREPHLHFTLESPDGKFKKAFLDFASGKPKVDLTVFSDLDFSGNVLLLDEIGGIELLNPDFAAALDALLQTDVPILGVLKGEGPAGALIEALGLTEEYEQAAKQLRQKLSDDPSTQIYSCGQFDETALSLAKQWAKIHLPH